ncbi:hypothetical protein ACIBCU_03105 [Streptomyces sp. NPDC051064]|uniref:hypothetical protein n=1 Tax=Streptomyces sp. NPDC051064 TaxID=3365641 RepID=UPI003789A3E8
MPVAVAVTAAKGDGGGSEAVAGGADPYPGRGGPAAGFPSASITGRQLVPAMLDELGNEADMTTVRNELDVLKVETFY